MLRALIVASFRKYGGAIADVDIYELIGATQFEYGDSSIVVDELNFKIRVVRVGDLPAVDVDKGPSTALALCNTVSASTKIQHLFNH